MASVGTLQSLRSLRRRLTWALGLQRQTNLTRHKEAKLKWIMDNANWIFSGVGIVVFSVLGYFAKRLFEGGSSGQKQNAGRNSVAIQAGRDVQVGNQNKQGMK